MQEKHLYSSKTLNRTKTQRDYEKQYIYQINNYLSQSFNTHTVDKSHQKRSTPAKYKTGFKRIA